MPTRTCARLSSRICILLSFGVIAWASPTTVTLGGTTYNKYTTTGCGALATLIRRETPADDVGCAAFCNSEPLCMGFRWSISGSGQPCALNSGIDETLLPDPIGSADSIFYSCFVHPRNTPAPTTAPTMAVPTTAPTTAAPTTAPTTAVPTAAAPTTAPTTAAPTTGDLLNNLIVSSPLPWEETNSGRVDWELSPVWSPSTTAYTLAVPHNTREVRVEPVTVEASTQVQVTVSPTASRRSVSELTVTGSLSLVDGTQTVTVNCTSGPAMTSETYTLDIVRMEASSSGSTDHFIMLVLLAAACLVLCTILVLLICWCRCNKAEPGPDIAGTEQEQKISDCSTVTNKSTLGSPMKGHSSGLDKAQPEAENSVRIDVAEVESDSKNSMQAAAEAAAARTEEEEEANSKVAEEAVTKAADVKAKAVAAEKKESETHLPSPPLGGGSFFSFDKPEIDRFNGELVTAAQTDRIQRMQTEHNTRRGAKGSKQTGRRRQLRQRAHADDDDDDSNTLEEHFRFSDREVSKQLGANGNGMFSEPTEADVIEARDKLAHQFHQADCEGVGFLTAAECEKMGSQDHFDKLDANGDGVVTEQEVMDRFFPWHLQKSTN